MTDNLVDILQLKNTESTKPQTFNKGVISLIGGGGKTSLMFYLAKKLAESGKTVLSTTTTKIFMPRHEDSPETIIAYSVDELISKSKICLKQYKHFSAAKSCDKIKKKLKGFDPGFIDQLHKADLFDWIITEADGARRKSIKATDIHEPVLPDTTTHLVLVAGIDIIGNTLDKNNVHRAEIFSKNTGLLTGEVINENSFAKSIIFEIIKGASLCNPDFNIIFLNKADNQKKMQIGNKISKLLQHQKSINHIITGSLKNEKFDLFHEAN